MAYGNSSLPVSSRPWRVIAEELTKETATNRILELSEELDRAQTHTRLATFQIDVSQIALGILGLGRRIPPKGRV